MTKRQAIALLALAGLFISIYLYLYKIGKIGTIACGTGGCETVQLSPQSRFLGVEVALIGILGYLVLLALGTLSTLPAYAGNSWPVRALALLSTGALAFTLYLKGLELFVIHAICRWCVASAVIIAIIFGLSVAIWREERRAA
jgi:uncharacterized membrane protein